MIKGLKSLANRITERSKNAGDAATKKARRQDRSGYDPGTPPSVVAEGLGSRDTNDLKTHAITAALEKKTGRPAIETLKNVKAGAARVASALAEQQRAAPKPAFGDALWQALRRLGGQSTREDGAERISSIEFTLSIMRNYKNPVQFFEQMHAKHGDSIRVSVPGHRFLIDDTPEVVVGALLGTDRRGKASAFEKPELQGHGLQFLTGAKNLFLGGGPDQWAMRTAMATPFNSRSIHSDPMYGGIKGVVDEWVHRVGQKAKAEGATQLELRSELQGLTLDITLRNLLGTRLPPDELKDVQQEFAVVMKWLTVETLNPTQFSFSKLGPMVSAASELGRAYEKLIALGDGVVKGMKDGTLRTPMLDALKVAKRANGRTLDDKELRDEILTIILAGHETTGTLLNWSLSALAQRPDVQEQIRAERRAAGPDAKYDDFSKLEMTNAVIEESLRLWSPAYFLVRKAVEDVEIKRGDDTVKIAKGTELIMSTFHMHRAESRWGVEKTGYPATEFFPERWTKKNREEHQLTDEDVKTYPFGHGTRVCLGVHMAKMEALLVVAQLAEQLDLSPPPGASGDLGLTSDIAVHPTQTHIQVKPRG